MNNLNKKAKMIYGQYDFLKVKSVDGATLNDFELEILKEKIIVALDEYERYCDTFEEVMENMRYFFEDIEAMEISMIIDNTGYDLDEDECETLSDDGYIIVEDSRYFNATDYIDYNELTTIVNLTEVIDYSTIKKFMHIYYKNEHCMYDERKTIVKLLNKKNIDEFTVSMLMHYVGFNVNLM